VSVSEINLITASVLQPKSQAFKQVYKTLTGQYKGKEKVPAIVFFRFNGRLCTGQKKEFAGVANGGWAFQCHNNSCDWLVLRLWAFCPSG